MKAIFAVINNLSSSENKAWPLRYRYSALLTELTSQLGVGYYVGSK